jgi:DHA3 family macrolide efflux protein-like MFS transporter
MLPSAIVAGLLAGLLAGGHIDNLARVARLRWVGLLFTALLVRLGTEAALRRDLPLVSDLRLPLFALAFGLLAFVLWRNRDRPGMAVALGGTLANATAILINGGYMPVWKPALDVSGIPQSELNPAYHLILTANIGSVDFLRHAGPLADIVPIAIPLPFIQNVASVGDLFIAAGIALFLFATLVARPEDLEPGLEPDAEGGVVVVRAGQALTLGRPLVLGGAVAGVSTTPTSSAFSAPELAPAAAGAAATAAPAIAVPAVPRPRHPYIRLALNADFSALWLGQLISLFGDRVHQIALGVLIYQATGSALGVGLVFLSATLPNLLVGPIAGTFVDRWGAKELMVASDLLRAGLVLVLPLAVAANVGYGYPIVFAVTAVSMFFRPARFAVIPRVVDREDLQPANSLSWIAESLADIVGYPLAGLFVAFVAANVASGFAGLPGGGLAVAFWLDAATYVVSAVLILSVTIPPLARAASERAAGLRAAVAEFRDELVGGWRFLRGERALFANTLVSMVGQLSIGATIALTVVYARDVLDGRFIGYPANYAALDGAIGLGNLLGGFVMGLLTARIRRGWLIGAGYLGMGVATALLAATGNVLAATALMFGSGVANMVFVIPTQTIFQERTPETMLGRVIGFRFSVVFGAITLAMGVSGYMATVVGVAAVFALFGGLTAVAGIAALLHPAIRES